MILFFCALLVACSRASELSLLKGALERYESTQNDQTRHLVFWCTDWCGGIGDRVAGITTVFYMALILNRKFSIWMPGPVPINTIFEPNKYNWTNAREPFCDNRLNAVDSIELLRLTEVKADSNMHQNFFSVCVSVNLLGITPLVNANPDIFGMQPEMFNVAKYFGEAFRFLFLPTMRLAESVEKLRRSAHLPPFACFACPSSSSPWYAVHFRTGNGTSWVDPVRDNLSAITNVVNCFKRSALALGWEVTKDTVYIASDNHFAKKNLARAIENSTLVDLPIAHTDRSDASIRGHYEAWTEFALLTHATCLVTSRSGYSEYAAFAGAWMHANTKSPRCLIGHLQCAADINRLLVGAPDRKKRFQL